MKHLPDSVVMKHTAARTEEHFSAGGVVFRTDQGQLQVVLCGRDVPAICLSGYSGARYEQRAREVGVDRMLEKPCLPDQLAQVAMEIAGRGRISPG